MATKAATAPSKLAGLFQARVTENLRPADLPVKPIAPKEPSAETTDGKQH